MPKFTEAVLGVVKEINECRTNPAGYAFKLEHYAETYIGKVRYREEDVPILSREGVSAVHECIRWLKSLSPVPALGVSTGLNSSCQAHCNALGMDGVISHQSEEEAPFLARLNKYGKWQGRVTEMLDFGSISAGEVVFTLLIDDGIRTRPHRGELLRADYRYIGVGFSPHEQMKSVCAIVLAGKFIDGLSAVRVVSPPNTSLRGTWEARGWLEGAVQLNCKITSEIENDRSLKRVAKLWLMADGTEKRTDEIIYETEDET